MVAYSIFLNFVEVFTLAAFVYLYYSFSSRKQFCLLLTSLFLICELCDILRENGIIILLSYFIVSYLFIIHEKQKLNFGDAAVDSTVSYNSLIVCSLILIVFFLIIINGIYFNRIYTEKMQYEKQLQKEKYIKQSLRLIQNISYDIDDKKHRIHWILEHIKHLNNDTNTEISKAIEQYQSKNTYQKLIASKNPVFDILISVKINRLQDDNISIKPFFEISQNEKYDDLDFIDVISEILDYVKRHNEITLHIKGQGIYTLVELYSENDFYDYDRCKIESDLIVKKKNIYKDGIYYMKFLLKGTDDDVRENL